MLSIFLIRHHHHHRQNQIHGLEHCLPVVIAIIQVKIFHPIMKQTNIRCLNPRLHPTINKPHMRYFLFWIFMYVVLWFCMLKIDFVSFALVFCSVKQNFEMFFVFFISLNLDQQQVNNQHHGRMHRIQHHRHHFKIFNDNNNYKLK